MLFLDTICLRGDVLLPGLADLFLPLAFAPDIFTKLPTLFVATFLLVPAGLGLAKSSEDDDPIEEARSFLLTVLAAPPILLAPLLLLVPFRPRSVASTPELCPLSNGCFRFCVEPLVLPSLRFALSVPLAPAPRSADDGVLLSLDEPPPLLDLVRSILYVTLGSDLHRFGIVMGAMYACYDSIPLPICNT